MDCPIDHTSTLVSHKDKILCNAECTDESELTQEKICFDIWLCPYVCTGAEREAYILYGIWKTKSDKSKSLKRVLSSKEVWLFSANLSHQMITTLFEMNFNTCT